MMDLHCHLDLYPHPRELVAACREARIYVLCVTTTPSAWKGTSALVSGADRIRPALGLHPQLAEERRGELGLFQEFLPEATYVGEVGLDGSRGFRASLPAQRSVFRTILEASAESGGKILSVHSRGAAAEVIDRLEEYPEAGSAILHWFSGTKRDLRRAIQLGCWFSVGEPMLRSTKGLGLLREMPRSRVLLESDGPFAKGPGGAPLTPLDSGRALTLLAEVWEESIANTKETLLASFRELLTSRPRVADPG